MLLYSEIVMQKAVAKQEKKPNAKLAQPWYFADV